LQIPLDFSIQTLIDLPYTISYVIRKRIQVSNLQEIPKDKRPPDLMIWDKPNEDIDEWLELVYDRKEKSASNEFQIEIKDIEG